MNTVTDKTNTLAAFMEKGASAELANVMVQWARLMALNNIPVLIYTVYRSDEAQRLLYAQGRTTKGCIVTNAKPGQSAHNRKHNGLPSSDAFDACPLIDNKPNWDTTGPGLLYWNVMGAAAEALGLKWGRNFKSLGGDWAHFEFIRTTTHH